MKIIADKDIPFLDYYFASAGDLTLVSGRDLQKSQLTDADILLVRSITKVDQALLEGTRVKFVASPTTGTDHFDIAWLNQAGIRWVNAHGCNAIGVEEYVVCVIAALQQQGYLNGNNLKAGVVGVGGIGSHVAQRLKQLGFRVALCDPLRAAVEKDFPHCPIETLCDVDLVSVHTPLTHTGSHPTYHMLNKDFLKRQKKNTVLINTGRGAVIDSHDLKLFGQPLLWCLDVWENEPWIDFEVLERAVIATPHIAGYTVQSKYRGTEMIYRAMLAQGIIPDHHIKSLQFPMQLSHDLPTHWRDKALTIYDPQTTTAMMKHALIENAGCFDQLRREFEDRHEFDCVGKG